MAKRFFNFFIILFGGISGFALVYFLDDLGLLKSIGGYLKTAIYVFGIIIFSLIFYMIFPKIIKGIEKSTRNMESQLSKLPLSEVVFGTIGMIAGLVVASLISSHFWRLSLEL